MTGDGRSPADIEWSDDGPPRSRTYGDVYFSREDGLAESRAVFLEGCGLPGAWSDRRSFTVAELGFGTGLNIVALLDLWSRTRPAGAHLSIFSVEAHLMDRAEAARALEAWPDLAAIAGPLLEHWPRPTRGFHRVQFEAHGATLDLAVMEVGEALKAWSGQADAWFLDGFSPALNPAMWRREVIDLIAARSAPSARLATYTVAGAVRRDLAEVGFDLSREPGFGRKRERLEGRLPGSPPEARPAAGVVIIGGGIAGASLRRAFAALGVDARVFADPASPGASRGPAALVAPRLDAGLGQHAALFAQAFHRAIDLYGSIPDATVGVGAVQLATGPDDPRRFAKIAGGDLFDPARVRMIGDATVEGLILEEALVVEPLAILTAWLPAVDPGRVAALVRHGDRWRLEAEDGVCLAEADIVVVAAGVAANALIPALGLGSVRGQASYTTGTAPAIATLFGGYAIPTRDGVMFGATHDRGDTGVEVREADHRRNLATLSAALPDLAGLVSNRPLEAHVGVRATTRDFMPLAGKASAESADLFVLGGLGSRGYCVAPLLAEHVAAMALGMPSPLPREIADLVDPERFARRARRFRVSVKTKSTK